MIKPEKESTRRTQGEERCVVTSRFYWKDLLKITSKTQDATILIFYFGLAEKAATSSQPRLEDIVSPPSRTTLNDFASKHKKYKKVEVRYQFESVDKAKDCIACVKATYKKLKQRIVPK